MVTTRRPADTTTATENETVDTKINATAANTTATATKTEAVPAEPKAADAKTSDTAAKPAAAKAKTSDAAAKTTAADAKTREPATKVSTSAAKPASTAAKSKTAAQPRATDAKTKATAKPATFKVNGKSMTVEKLIAENERLAKENNRFKKEEKKSVQRRREEKSLKPFQAELIKLQKHLEIQKRRAIIIFEGRDAAGKGGTIRRVTRYMNEKHYRIVALGKPTDDQRTQWFFQRYVTHFPRGGEIVLFDRSWYNRAMVEPVFGFCTEQQYKEFMAGVTGFEKDLVRHGTVLVKLYFSVVKDEQARRFERRKTDPLRQWKLSEVDVQAQERWDEFTHVKYEMLRRTHTTTAPWTIIRSNDKYLARFNAMKVILNSVDYEGRDRELDYVPDPDVVVSGAREIERMEADRIKTGRFSG